MRIHAHTSRPRRGGATAGRRQDRRVVASVAAVSLALVGLGVGQTAVAGTGTTPPSHASAGVDYPFQDTSLTPDQRVRDLVSRLTLDEKVGLLHQFSAAVVRLGIPQFRTGTEGLHGVSWLGTATVFPQAAGIAMTWNPELADQIGDVIGQEARAYNSVDARFNGVDLWGPVVDPARDPRSGRASESLGEDPYLTGVMSTGMAAGMQGQGDGTDDGDFYYQGIPMLKHFVAYGQEASRTSYSANASPRNLQEYYFRGFDKAIEAGAANGLMTSYNLVNGKPTMVVPELQDDVYGQWVPGGNDGAFFAVTDAGSPGNLSGSNAYYPNSTQGQAASMADSIKNGVAAMTPGDTDTPTTRRWIYEALARGMITEKDIDKAIYGVLLVRLHAGDLDVDAHNPYKQLTKQNALDTPEHRAVASDAAHEQVVLLKNDDGVLPLSKADDVALVGPQSDESSTDFYAGTFPYMSLISDEMKAKVTAGHGSLETSRGVDTVALQVTNGTGAPDGKFVTTGDTAASPLTGTATSADDPHAQFQLYDYGYNNLLLRSVATDRYVAARGSGNTLVADADPPGVESVNRASQQWTTDQNLGLVSRSGDTVSLRFAKGTGIVSPTQAPNVFVGTTAPYTVQHNGSASSTNRQFRLVTVQDGIEDAVAKAKDADVAVVAVGDQPHMTSRETQDRTSSDPGIDLAPQQEKLVDAVAAANPNTVVVIVGSYPFDISAIKANPNVKGIVYTTHAGQELGSAVADVLFGDYAPSGRLDQTWYPGVDSLPAISDYDVIKGGRTYQYHTGDVLYPFGYGLTYTTFDYSHLDVGKSKVANTKIDATSVPVSVQVRNTGTVASDEVVELYASYDDAASSRVQHPIRTLVGFTRVHLGAGKSTTVTLDVQLADLAIWDVDGDRSFVEPGTYTLAFQTSAAASDKVASGSLTVTGAGLPARTLTDVTRADTFDDYSFTDLTSAGLRADLVGSSVHEDDSYGITVRKAGAWAKYADVDLSKKPAAIALRAANPGTTTADVEVWTGGPDAASGGTRVGTVQVPATGSAQTFVSVGAALSGLPTGTSDVYLVFPTANVSVSWFKLGALVPAKDRDVTVHTDLYTSSIATSLTRFHVRVPASIQQKGGSLVVESTLAAPAVATGPVTWSVTDADGNPTTLATVGPTGQLTATGTGDGTVRVVATYPTADGTAQGAATVTLKNQAVAAGTDAEAVIIRSGWDSRPPDISWGPNQFTQMGSIDQKQGSLLLSAVTYPFTSTTRPVTFTVADKDGHPTDLATIVTKGAGFIEGQTSGDNNRAYNATLTATGAGDGEVYVKATTENGLSYTSRIVIQGQTTRDPYAGRTQAELFDADGNVGGGAADLRADNVQGDDVGLQLDRVRDGDWAEYRDVDLGNPKSLELTMRYQKASSAPATITVKADDPVDGPVLGTVTVTGKLDLASSTDYRNPVYSWKDATLALTPLSGVHDLYLVFGVSPDVPDTDISSTYGAVPGWLDLGLNWFTLSSPQTGPSIEKVSVADGDTVSGTVAFQVDLGGDAKDVSYTYVELNKGSSQVWVTDNTKAPGSTNAGLHPTLVVDTTTLANGAYGLKIDAVGTNGKTTEKKVSFTVDNPPRLSFVTPKDGSTVSGKVAVTVDLAGQGLQAYNLRVDSAGLSYAYQPKAGEQTFTWDTTTVADGVHTLLATATDDAGNKTTVTEKVSVDNAPKVAAWDASAVYLSGDRVSYGGSTWTASWWTQNQEPGDPNGPWQEIVQTADGTAAWTASRIFDNGDTAVYGGVTYVAQWWTRNQKPGDPNGPWKKVG